MFSFTVSVASRSVEHAGAVAEPLGAAALDLQAAARIATRVDAVVVALSGEWPGAATLGEMPPLVDLSAPVVTRAPRPPRRLRFLPRPRRPRP